MTNRRTRLSSTELGEIAHLGEMTLCKPPQRTPGQS